VTAAAPPRASTPVIEISAVSKDYHGLRPLRIQELTVFEGQRVAILGLDEPMAETFVNLATGAALPESGVITLFGRSTATIDDSADWLTIVDRFGIVSARSVLLEALSVIQNLSMPFTLDIDPPAEDVRRPAADLAREMGLPESSWSRPAGELDRAGHARLRAARALALDPAIVLLEHATAGLSAEDASRFAADLRDAATRRRCALIALTSDTGFAAAVADRVLKHTPSTGALSARTGLLDRFFER
jgi:ABC-type polar amino acid transport system ATPase subunit